LLRFFINTSKSAKRKSCTGRQLLDDQAFRPIHPDIFVGETQQELFFLPGNLNYFFYGRSAPSGGNDNFSPSAFLLPEKSLN